MSGPLKISLKDELSFIRSMLIPAFDPDNELDTSKKRKEWMRNEAADSGWDARVSAELIKIYGIVVSLEEAKGEKVKMERLIEDERQSGDVITEVLTEVRGLREGLAKAEIRRLRGLLDCWHSNARTVMESHVFKESLVTYYGCSRTTDVQLKCMVTGNFYPRHEVRATHIIKRSTDGDTMHLYGLPPNSIDYMRNGLLLLEPIEQAFDRKDICFLHNSLTNELVVKVLNPSLMNEQMPKASPHGATYTQTYGSIDGLVLQLPSGVFPYRRALSMHAKFAYSTALHFGWIDDKSSLDSYFNLSDNGLQEPLGLGLLTWKEVKQHSIY